jgi:hypothetical protein
MANLSRRNNGSVASFHARAEANTHGKGASASLPTLFRERRWRGARPSRFRLIGKVVATNSTIISPPIGISVNVLPT